MNRLIFITHPEVVVDPDREITDWELSETGMSRAKAFAKTPFMSAVTAIWSSKERKAIDTAACLAAPKGLHVTTHAGLGENDRSATGFLPPEHFEAAADSFFAKPDTSFRGWERAVDAQTRIVATVRKLVADHVQGDLAIVSHGAVGTLLWCSLKGKSIDRRYDQPSQGHYWCASIPSLVPKKGWTTIG